jgi:DNA-binding CsgD family transcriptional regulator
MNLAVVSAENSFGAPPSVFSEDARASIFQCLQLHASTMAALEHTAARAIDLDDKSALEDIERIACSPESLSKSTQPLPCHWSRMTVMHSLRIDDVLAQPGQNLTTLELAVLEAMANGNSPSAIAAATGCAPGIIRNAELNARDKLGAKTQPHMIARGFVLGVLLPRALCLLVAIMAAGEHNPAQRVRMPRNSRAPSSLVRLTRASSGRGGHNGAGALC